MRVDPLATASRVVTGAIWTHVRVPRTKDLGKETDNDREGNAAPGTEISRRGRQLQAGPRAGGDGDAQPPRRPRAFDRDARSGPAKWSNPAASSRPPPGSLISTPSPSAALPTGVSVVSAASRLAAD